MMSDYVFLNYFAFEWFNLLIGDVLCDIFYNLIIFSNVVYNLNTNIKLGLWSIKLANLFASMFKTLKIKISHWTSLFYHNKISQLNYSNFAVRTN